MAVIRLASADVLAALRRAARAAEEVCLVALAARDERDEARLDALAIAFDGALDEWEAASSHLAALRLNRLEPT